MIFSGGAGRVKRVRRSDGYHRVQRIAFSRMLSFTIEYISKQLYYIGASIERTRKTVFRVLRRSIKKGAKAVWRAICWFFSLIWRIVTSALADIFNPLRKFFRSVKSLFDVWKEMKGQSFGQKLHRTGLFIRYGWMWNKQLLARFMSYLMPVVCAALCFVVISTVLSFHYVIAVSCNGQNIGYIEDERVYDSAVKIIDSRLIDIDENSWKPSANLSIAIAPKGSLVTQDTMANNLLSASGAEIVDATGLYVGGEFYGATTAGDMLQQAIEDVIEPYRVQANSLGSDVSVKFSREVELVSGIFPAQSVKAYDEMYELISSSDAKDIYYRAAGGENVSDIALANGLTIDKLQQLNPDIDLSQQLLLESANLLVARAEPLLAVKTIRTVTKVTSIAFDTLVTKDNRFNVGYYFVVTKGQVGELTTVTEIEYENGREISRSVISETVTKPAITQEIVVGTNGAGAGSSVGSGAMVWPTGGGYRVTRGFTAGHHLGVDIAAPLGTPIYAADSGVVTVATTLPWDYGTYCIVDHQNNICTVYGHCSALLVTVGEVVERGQLIALMGSTGNSTGSHLHFEVRVGGVKVDPYIYLYN